SLASEAITECPCGQQERCKDEHISIYNPLQITRTGPQSAGKRGQRNVENGVVDGDDDDADTKECQPKPASVVARFFCQYATNLHSHFPLIVTYTTRVLQVNEVYVFLKKRQEQMF